ncbi:hypothetical protein C8R44DRAFT_771642 [Mycena epipterygia]|nr:hypothetical protein C8R44DRAFT_771642 [Mycena epipterygia]
MFIFAMTEMALQIVTATLSMRSLYSTVHGNGTIYSEQWDSLQRMSLILGFIEDLLLVTNNTITDSLLIYRCYVIWDTNYRKKVVILPLFLLLVTTVVGYVTVYRNDIAPPGSHLDTRITLGLAMTTNLVLTGLTVGRIWWTRRHLRTVGQTKFIQRYNTAMSLLLESSALYSICLSILLVALSFKTSRETGPLVTYVSYGFGGQLVNIIPALVIVRVSFGRKMDMESPVTQSKLAAV